MSKKSRRQRTPNLPPEAFQTPVAKSKPSPAPDSEASSPVRATMKTAANADLRPEYGDVISDLRLTLLIFVALVAVMVALSFFVV
jgi:hypothetical protein